MEPFPAKRETAVSMGDADWWPICPTNKESHPKGWLKSVLVRWVDALRHPPLPPSEAEQTNGTHPKRTRVLGSGVGTGLYWYVTVPVNSASVTWPAAVFPPVFARYVWVKVEAGNTIVPGPLNSARISGEGVFRCPSQCSSATPNWCSHRPLTCSSRPAKEIDLRGRKIVARVLNAQLNIRVRRTAGATIRRVGHVSVVSMPALKVKSTSVSVPRRRIELRERQAAGPVGQRVANRRARGKRTTRYSLEQKRQWRQPPPPQHRVTSDSACCFSLKHFIRWKLSFVGGSAEGRVT